jgi:hypothetical protein
VIARTLASACLGLLLKGATAWAYPDLDWKLYSSSIAAGGGNVCFYEERSVARRRGDVRVWTKCLARRDLAAADAGRRNLPYGRAVLDMAVSRRVYGYVPPILSLDTLDRKAVVTAIEYEAIADVGGLAPTSMTFYELNCRAARMRVVGGTENDRTLSPSAWDTIAAKGMSSRLRRLMCGETTTPPAAGETPVARAEPSQTLPAKPPCPNSSRSAADGRACTKTQKTASLRTTQHGAARVQEKRKDQQPR